MNNQVENVTYSNLRRKQKEAITKPSGEIFDIVDERLRKPVNNPVPRANREAAFTRFAEPMFILTRGSTQSLIDERAAPFRDETGTFASVVDIALLHSPSQPLRRKDQSIHLVISNRLLLKSSR